MKELTRCSWLFLIIIIYNLLETVCRNSLARDLMTYTMQNFSALHTITTLRSSLLSSDNIYEEKCQDDNKSILYCFNFVCLRFLVNDWLCNNKLRIRVNVYNMTILYVISFCFIHLANPEHLAGYVLNVSSVSPSNRLHIRSQKTTTTRA